MPRKGNPHTLKPFRKGADPRRNINGQPKKLPELEKLLADCLDGEWEQIIKALLTKAKHGDVRAADLLLDRAFGRAKLAIKSTVVCQPLIPDNMTQDQELLYNEMMARLKSIDDEYSQS